MTEEGSIFVVKNFCECNCGTEIPIGRRFVRNHHMRGERNNHYNGGIRIDPKGYRRILKPDHHFADSHGSVMEHRLVWEEYHKASLLPWADVHHINIHNLPPKENILDNTPENLHAMMHGHHTYLTNHLDVSNRICAICGGKTCVRPSGKEVWYKYNLNQWMCNKCYWYEKGKKKKLV